MSAAVLVLLESSTACAGARQQPLLEGGCHRSSGADGMFTCDLRLDRRICSPLHHGRDRATVYHAPPPSQVTAHPCRPVGCRGVCQSTTFDNTSADRGAYPGVLSQLPLSQGHSARSCRCRCASVVLAPPWPVSWQMCLPEYTSTTNARGPSTINRHGNEEGCRP